MNIKDLFEKAENGTLTYDQFVEFTKANKAKFVDLSEGGYVDKQKHTDELSARDTRITSLDANLGELRQKLDAAGTDAEKLNQISTSFAELQAKYDADTANYTKKLKDQSYKYAVNEFAAQHKFSSVAAKRDFINSLLSKDFQLENDSIVGATDFVASYTKDNSDAFVSESTPATPPATPRPHFAGPTAPGVATPEDSGTPFQFKFAGVRPAETK